MQGITAITFDGAGGGGEIIISRRKAQPNPRARPPGPTQRPAGVLTPRVTSKP